MQSAPFSPQHPIACLVEKGWDGPAVAFVRDRRRSTGGWRGGVLPERGGTITRQGAPRIVYIILAAAGLEPGAEGTAFDNRGGTSPLARTAAALGEREAFIVVAPERIDDSCREAPDALTIVDDQPERGASYALKVALAAVPPDRDVAVLYAGAQVDDAMLLRLEDAFSGDCDVVYPSNGTSGYPIIFSAAARAAVAGLADGDTIGLIRDDPSLRRCAIPG